MPTTTKTEMREFRELVLGLREEMQLGFANNNSQFVALNGELKAEIKRVEDELKTEVKRVEIELKTEIKRVETELKTEVKRVETELKTEIKQVEFDLTSQFQKADASSQKQLTALQGSINVLEERTKLGFWGFVWRSIIIAILTLLVSFAVRYILFGSLRI